MATDATGTADVGADFTSRLAQLEALTGAADRFGSALTAGMKSAVIAGKSLDDVLRQMALRLSSSALSAALKPLTSLFGSLAGGLAGSFGSALSGLLSSALPLAKGGIVPFAAGGVVASPTYFPLAGGVGVAGEAGAEAILPLARGADGSLGVRGGSAVNVTFNVTTANAASFRQSEAQVTAMLARAVGRGRRGL